MAVQPPPSAIAPQQAVPPTATKSSGCFGRGCGCSLLGCAGVVVLAVLLVLGSGYWFLVVQASAAVTARATLVVYNLPVTVDHKAAAPGQALNAGNEVATQAKGHAAIQFPDGSFVRMSPDTTVQITTVQLQKNGNLQSAEVAQKVGRTFVNVQHLVSGATFKVGGHSVSAQVRGTADPARPARPVRDDPAVQPRRFQRHHRGHAADIGRRSNLDGPDGRGR